MYRINNCDKTVQEIKYLMQNYFNYFNKILFNWVCIVQFEKYQLLDRPTLEDKINFLKLCFV